MLFSPRWRSVRQALALELAVGLMTSLTACASGSPGTVPQGTLNGAVVAGSTCPGERVDHPSPHPGPNRVILIKAPALVP